MTKQIVLAAIATILIGIAAYPSFIRFRTNARHTYDIHSVQMLAKAQDSYFANFKNLPADFSEAGFKPTDEIIFYRDNSDVPFEIRQSLSADQIPFLAMDKYRAVVRFTNKKTQATSYWLLEYKKKPQEIKMP